MNDEHDQHDEQDDDQDVKRPTPTTEPPQPPPGGPNAIGGVGGDGAATAGSDPVPRDLDPRLKPGSKDVPDGLEEGEDTETQATKGDAQPRPDEEAPA